MEDFDFIKGFLNFDILQAEAIAKVVSRVTAVAIKEMIDTGLTEDQATKIFNNTVRTALEVVSTIEKKE
jgi:predicted RNA methylase